MERVIKQSTQHEKYVFQPFNNNVYSEDENGFLYQTINNNIVYNQRQLKQIYDERSALLNQAIRANRDYAHILKLSEDLYKVVNPIMRGVR